MDARSLRQDQQRGRARWWRSRLRSKTGGSEQGRSILCHSAIGGLTGAWGVCQCRKAQIARQVRRSTPQEVTGKYLVVSEKVRKRLEARIRYLERRQVEGPSGMSAFCAPTR